MVETQYQFQEWGAWKPTYTYSDGRVRYERERLGRQSHDQGKTWGSWSSYREEKMEFPAGYKAPSGGYQPPAGGEEVIVSATPKSIEERTVAFTPPAPPLQATTQPTLAVQPSEKLISGLSALPEIYGVKPTWKVKDITPPTTGYTYGTGTTEQLIGRGEPSISHMEQERLDNMALEKEHYIGRTPSGEPITIPDSPYYYYHGYSPAEHDQEISDRYSTVEGRLTEDISAYDKALQEAKDYDKYLSDVKEYISSVQSAGSKDTITLIETDPKTGEQIEVDYTGRKAEALQKLQEYQKNLEATITELPTWSKTRQELINELNIVRGYKGRHYTIEITDKGYQFDLPTATDVYRWKHGEGISGTALSASAFLSSPLAVRTLFSAGQQLITGDRKVGEAEIEKLSEYSLGLDVGLKRGDYTMQVLGSPAMTEGVYIPLLTLGASKLISTGIEAVTPSLAEGVAGVTSKFTPAGQQLITGTKQALITAGKPFIATGKFLMTPAGQRIQEAGFYIGFEAPGIMEVAMRRPEELGGYIGETAFTFGLGWEAMTYGFKKAPVERPIGEGELVDVGYAKKPGMIEYVGKGAPEGRVISIYEYPAKRPLEVVDVPKPKTDVTIPATWEQKLYKTPKYYITEATRPTPTGKLVAEEIKIGKPEVVAEITPKKSMFIQIPPRYAGEVKYVAGQYGKLEELVPLTKEEAKLYERGVLTKRPITRPPEGYEDYLKTRTEQLLRKPDVTAKRPSGLSDYLITEKGEKIKIKVGEEPIITGKKPTKYLDVITTKEGETKLLLGDELYGKPVPPALAKEEIPLRPFEGKITDVGKPLGYRYVDITKKGFPQPVKPELVEIGRPEAPQVLIAEPKIKTKPVKGTKYIGEPSTGKPSLPETYEYKDFYTGYRYETVTPEQLAKMERGVPTYSKYWGTTRPTLTTIVERPTLKGAVPRPDELIAPTTVVIQKLGRLGTGETKEPVDIYSVGKGELFGGVKKLTLGELGEGEGEAEERLQDLWTPPEYIEREEEDLGIIQESMPVLGMRQDLLSGVKQELALKTTGTLTELDLISREEIEEPTKPRVPKIPMIKIPGLPKKEEEEEREYIGAPKQEAYDVYVKERGMYEGKVRKPIKFMKMTRRPVEYTDALSLGGELTDKTSAVSFRLKKVRERPSPLDQPAERFSSRSHKFTKRGETYIEKPEYRMDTPGELQQVSALGWSKRRGQNKRKKDEGLFSPRMKTPTTRSTGLRTPKTKNTRLFSSPLINNKLKENFFFRQNKKKKGGKKKDVYY